MGRHKTYDSVRQKLIRLKVNDTLAFPNKKYDYVTSLVYRLGKTFGYKYSCRANGAYVNITRIS